MTEPKGEGAIEEALKHLEERHACDWPTSEGAWAALASLRTAKEELEKKNKLLQARCARAEGWFDSDAESAEGSPLERALAAKETAEAEVERLRQELIETQHRGMDWSERAETAERERDEWRDRATTAEYRLAMKHPWTMSDDEDAALRTALSHSEAERGRLEERVKFAAALLTDLQRARDGDVDIDDLLQSEHLDGDLLWMSQGLSNQPSNQEGESE